MAPQIGQDHSLYWLLVDAFLGNLPTECQLRFKNIHVEHGGARKSSPPLRMFLTWEVGELGSELHKCTQALRVELLQVSSVGQLSEADCGSQSIEPKSGA